jgi:hypothetical protein
VGCRSGGGAGSARPRHPYSPLRGHLGQPDPHLRVEAGALARVAPSTGSAPRMAVERVGCGSGGRGGEQVRRGWRRGRRGGEQGAGGAAGKGTEVRVRGRGGGIRLGVGWWEGVFTKVSGVCL